MFSVSIGHQLCAAHLGCTMIRRLPSALLAIRAFRIRLNGILQIAVFLQSLGNVALKESAFDQPFVFSAKVCSNVLLSESATLFRSLGIQSGRMSILLSCACCQICLVIAFRSGFGP